MSTLHFGCCALLLLLVAGVALRKRTGGGACVIAASIGLLLWTMPFTTGILTGYLERRYRPLVSPPDAETIVVLSGGVDGRTPSSPEDLPNRGTFLRCRYAAWLWRHGLPRPVLATGGIADGSCQVPVSVVMARTLEEAGVPPSFIRTEETSRTTYENAVNSARILRASGIRRIVLVTEAYHMWRAEACFRKQGFAVTAAPVAFRGGNWRAVPSVAAIAWNEDFLHEALGLSWYRLRGRI